MNNTTLADLKKLNFEEIIHIDTDDAANYTYEAYAANGREHKLKADGAGGCIRCENSGLASHEEIDSKPKLSLISHGTHSQDYLSLITDRLKDRRFESSIIWRDNPVLFVLENPSTDSGQYQEGDIEGIRKKPAKSWYWLPDESKLDKYRYSPLEYAKNSTQGKYGEYFASIIYRFGLRNAYITNMMKCGVSIEGELMYDSNKFKCVRDNCISQYLDQEIKIFQPEAIFAFGHRTYNVIKRRFKNYSLSERLFYLPHPGDWRKKKRIYQEISHKHLVIGLKETDIINDIEEQYLSTDFANIISPII